MPCLSTFKPPRGLGRFGCTPQPDYSLCKSCSSAQCSKKAIQVSSGIAVALCVQLGSPIDARATEEMIAVPRGALEELLVRDFSTRVHNMEPTALASFMDSLRSMTAPEPRNDSQRAFIPSEPAIASDGSGRQSGRQEPSVKPVPPRAIAQAETQQPRGAGSSTSQSSSEAGQPPQPELRVPETSASSPVQDPTDDFTAELLGLREKQAQQSRESRAVVARSAAWTSISGIAGLPLAIWTFLDTLLPEPLQPGQELTEEVQRAVLATKGIVLIVSSTLAVFLARGLSRQLAKAAAGIPLLRAIADASSTAAQNISKLSQKSPVDPPPPPSAQQRDSAAEPRVTDAPATRGSLQAQPQQLDREKGTDSAGTEQRQSRGFDAVRSWVSRAADVLPGGSNPPGTTDRGSDAAGSRSTDSATVAESSDSRERYVESWKKKGGTVPLLPNAQTAMLSVVGAQSAQLRPRSSPSQQAGLPAEPRLSDNAVPARSRASVDLRGSRAGGTRVGSDRLRTSRGVELREVPESDIDEAATASVSPVRPGVLWKRTAGRGPLSGKWGDESEPSAALSTLGAPQMVDGGSLDEAVAPQDLDVELNGPSREQEVILNDTRLVAEGSSRATASLGAEGNAPADRSVADQSSKVRRKASGWGAPVSENPRVYNGVRPGSANGHKVVSSRTGATEDGADSDGSESALKLASGGSADAGGTAVGAPDDGKKTVKAESKPADEEKEKTGDPWFL